MVTVTVHGDTEAEAADALAALCRLTGYTPSLAPRQFVGSDRWMARAAAHTTEAPAGEGRG